MKCMSAILVLFLFFCTELDTELQMSSRSLGSMTRFIFVKISCLFRGRILHFLKPLIMLLFFSQRILFFQTAVPVNAETTPLVLLWIGGPHIFPQPSHNEYFSPCLFERSKHSHSLSSRWWLTRILTRTRKGIEIPPLESWHLYRKKG